MAGRAGLYNHPEVTQMPHIRPQLPMWGHACSALQAVPLVVIICWNVHDLLCICFPVAHACPVFFVPEIGLAHPFPIPWIDQNPNCPFVADFFGYITFSEGVYFSSGT